MGCTEKPAKGRTLCGRHLRLMVAKQQARYSERQRQSLCSECGERPRFWTTRCVVCRAKYTDKPLPSAARKVLRLYREAERQRALEHAQVEARFAARKLLVTGEAVGTRARALRIYVGADAGVWRTYQRVGQRLGHHQATSS